MKKKQKKEFKDLKICFVCSSGGHLEEISQLKLIEKKYENFLITEKNDFHQSSFGSKQYYIPQTNRKEVLFIFKFFYLFIISFFILLKEKPNVIISTGALSSFPVCLLGKVFNCKIIYIESFARCDKPSLTGKLVYKFADLFIVQWNDLLKFYPNAICGGGIF